MYFSLKTLEILMLSDFWTNTVTNIAHLTMTFKELLL